MAAIQNRYDFLMLFDVTNGNPNGDPDADNLPRIDPETGRGLVSDVCLKRKVRNYVLERQAGVPGYDIYIQQEGTLNERDDLAIKQFKKDDKDIVTKAEKVMAETFFDVRTFGAVMTNFKKQLKKGGQILGPVQMCVAESVDSISPTSLTITRMAVAKESDKAAKGDNTMGRKHIVPYALYCVRGFISAPVAEKTGFSEEDLAVFWDALMNMFDMDHSAARGMMSMKKLVVFKHESQYGNDHADRLFERVHVTRKDDVICPRCYADYDVTIDASNLRPGIEILVSNDEDELVTL